jgi:hypothetical protein
MVADARANRLYVMGGYGVGYFADLFSYDIISNLTTWIGGQFQFHTRSFSLLILLFQLPVPLSACSVDFVPASADSIGEQHTASAPRMHFTSSMATPRDCCCSHDQGQAPLTLCRFFHLPKYPVALDLRSMHVAFSTVQDGSTTVRESSGDSEWWDLHNFAMVGLYEIECTEKVGESGAEVVLTSCCYALLHLACIQISGMSSPSPSLSIDLTLRSSAASVMSFWPASTRSGSNSITLGRLNGFTQDLNFSIVSESSVQGPSFTLRVVQLDPRSNSTGTLISAPSSDNSWTMTISGRGLATSQSSSGTAAPVTVIPVNSSSVAPIAMDSTALTYWVSGDDCSVMTRSQGFYPPKGVTSDQGLPSARSFFAYWTSNWDGNLYLYGGFLSDGIGGSTPIADVWRFSRNTRQWTLLWLSEQPTPRNVVYGTRLVPSSLTNPGGRAGASFAADNTMGVFVHSGSNWLTVWSDLFRFDVATGQWTYVAGTSSTNVYPNYTTIGVSKPAASTVGPGSRYTGVMWYYAGQLFLFGGLSSKGLMNDLFCYSIANDAWTFLHGSTEGAGAAAAQANVIMKGTATAASLPYPVSCKELTCAVPDLNEHAHEIVHSSGYGFFVSLCHV